jgi:hypothetical protein
VEGTVKCKKAGAGCVRCGAEVIARARHHAVQIRGVRRSQLRTIHVVREEKSKEAQGICGLCGHKASRKPLKKSQQSNSSGRSAAAVQSSTFLWVWMGTVRRCFACCHESAASAKIWISRYILHHEWLHARYSGRIGGTGGSIWWCYTATAVQCTALPYCTTRLDRTVPATCSYCTH